MQVLEFDFSYRTFYTDNMIQKFLPNAFLTKAPQQINPFFKTKLFIGSILLVFLLILAGLFLYKYLLSQTSLNQFFPKPSPSLAPLSQGKGPYKLSLQVGPFHCPSIPDFCRSGKYDGSAVMGKLSKGSPLYAAFAGTISLAPMPPKEETLILLVDEVRGLQGVYALKDPIITQAKTVKEGEIIATASGEIIPQLKDVSFSFALSRIANVSWEQYPISKETFK